MVTGAYLIGNGTINNVGYGDCTWLAYPGQFGGIDGSAGVPADDSSPYRTPSKGAGIYILPGTGPTVQYPNGQPTQPGMQFELYAWTGNFSSYSAAYAASFSPSGPCVAVTPPFQVGPTSYGISFLSDAFEYMPSMLLTHPSPEPSTLLLTATGLLGLLAYAWRRRRRR